MLLAPRGDSAIYQLSGYTGVSLWLSIDDSSTTIDRLAGGATFDLKDFTFDPNCTDVAHTCPLDGAGNLIVHVGATLNHSSVHDIRPRPLSRNPYSDGKLLKTNQGDLR